MTSGAEHTALLESELSKNPSIRRLQNLLDVVLRREFEDIMRSRDALYNKVSEQVQFQKLLKQDLRLADQPAADAPDAPRTIMHDLGCKFFVQCQLLDPRVVHVNVGCGVIVAMTIPEALAHSKRAETSLRSRSDKLTKQALNAKYKQRLVMEAIMRLQDIQIEADLKRRGKR